MHWKYNFDNTLPAYRPDMASYRFRMFEPLKEAHGSHLFADEVAFPVFVCSWFGNKHVIFYDNII